MTIAVLKCSLPVLLASMVLGILAHGVQTRFNVSFQVVKPKFSKLNPINGIKKMFSIKKLVDLAKNLIKIALLLILLYNLLKSDIVEIARMIDMNLLSSSGRMLELVFDLVALVGYPFKCFGSGSTEHVHCRRIRQVEDDRFAGFIFRNDRGSAEPAD